MATIYDTTLVPGKLDLLARWLPTQPWFAGTGDGLSRGGGFRLDDPAGEVGLEFMVVTTGDDAAYLVPMAYRGAPVDGADHALIGTCEHGVLGPRWFYDGEHDPVLRAQLAALVRGEVAAQAQTKSDTADPSVLVTPVPGAVEVRVHRALDESDPPPDATGWVSVQWHRTDGSTARGVVASARA